MHKVYYHPGRGGNPICLDGDGAFIGFGEGLRSHKWTRTLTNRTVRGLSLGVREVSFNVVADFDKADELRRICDADVAVKKPGTITVDDKWSIRAYIVESQTDTAYFGAVELSVKVVLLDAQWWSVSSRHYVTGLSEDGLDYPYDHPNDMSFVSGKGSLTVKSPQGALPRITFYGACTNPYITVTKSGFTNRYEVDVQILSGFKCVIDATGSKPTVTLYDSYGNAQSKFQYAVRTGGIGGGSYAFETLPQGDLQVTWSGAFVFDIEWMEQDTEPPWSN